MTFPLSKLPIELLSYILSFINNKFEKKFTFLPNKKDNLGYKMIDKVFVIPSELSLINKNWYAAILYSKCKICSTGTYNLKTMNCINCGHIIESKVKRIERRKRIKN